MDETDTALAAPAPALLSITTMATEYLVSAVPLTEHKEAARFAVWVQWRGGDRYCVSQSQGMRPNRVLDRALRWQWESRPSERTDNFIAATRFDLHEALALASAVAPFSTVNGLAIENARVVRRGQALRWCRKCEATLDHCHASRARGANCCDNCAHREPDGGQCADPT